MSANIIEKFFDSKDAYNKALGEDLAACLANGIEQDGRAVLMVSGGSSPAPAYRYLSGLDMAWDKIDIAMVDERWVDADGAVVQRQAAGRRASIDIWRGANPAGRIGAGRG